MSRALGALGCTIMILFISALVVTAANAWWPALAAELAASSLALGGWALHRTRANERRWAAVRALLREAYESNQTTMSLHTVAAVIGGPEVREAKRRYETMLATRYANGDSSDY